MNSYDPAGTPVVLNALVVGGVPPVEYPKEAVPVPDQEPVVEAPDPSSE